VVRGDPRPGDVVRRRRPRRMPGIAAQGQRGAALRGQV